MTKTEKRKTIGDLINKLNKCNEEEDFVKFYNEYWELVENEIQKEKEKDASWGMKRPIGDTFERVRSNLYYLLDNVPEMRRNFAFKVWWFLQ